MIIMIIIIILIIMIIIIIIIIIMKQCCLHVGLFFELYKLQVDLHVTNTRRSSSWNLGYILI